MWFLLRLTAAEREVRLDASERPEFDQWRWVDFWYPLEHVVNFKRRVYAQALLHLAPLAQAVALSTPILDAAPEQTADSGRPREPVLRRA